MSSRRCRMLLLLILAALAMPLLASCASDPKMRESGFLSDYSKLEKVGDSRRVYGSGRVGEYDAFIVDPVIVSMPVTKLSPQDRAEAMRYFHAAAVKMIDAEFDVTDEPGVGVARFRIALTDVAKSSWWKEQHPETKAKSAGIESAALEAEIIDSVTGEQLGAAIQAGIGNQFDVAAYATLADVKNAIDRWAEEASARLREVRAKAAARR